MKSTSLPSIRQFWDKQAIDSGAASVIDPNDKRGSKNRYIALARFLAILESLGNFPVASSLLDFGCGSGDLLAKLTSIGNMKMLVGADISFQMLQTARKVHMPYRQSLVHFDGERLPFAAASLDVITLSGGVLIYIHDDEALKRLGREFARILRPGGGIIAVEQVRSQRYHDAEQEKTQRSPTALIGAFVDAGFDISEWRSIRRGRFPLVYLIRYGLIPECWFRFVANLEAKRWKNSKAPRLDYADALFVFKRR